MSKRPPPSPLTGSDSDDKRADGVRPLNARSAAAIPFAWEQAR